MGSWSKILSFISGADEEDVMVLSGAVSNLTGIWDKETIDDQFRYVCVKIAHDYPVFKEMTRKRLGLSDAGFRNIYRTPESAIVDMIYWYYLKWNHDTKFVTVFKNVLVNKFGYDDSGDPNRLSYAIHLLYKEIVKMGN